MPLLYLTTHQGVNLMTEETTRKLTMPLENVPRQGRCCLRRSTESTAYFQEKIKSILIIFRKEFCYDLFCQNLIAKRHFIIVTYRITKSYPMRFIESLLHFLI